jgi:hypothetical protein
MIFHPLVTLPRMRIYRGFPERLHHRVPALVEPGALFHLRVLLEREKEQKAQELHSFSQDLHSKRRRRPL